jgi:hypothetical protein
VVSLFLLRSSAWALTSYPGSYDAITLGKYTNLVKIYGEHTRLCLNSLSLNLITANVEEDGSRPHQVAAPCLARACEAAVALVQCYTDSSDAEPIVRYGGDVSVSWPTFVCAR